MSHPSDLAEMMTPLLGPVMLGTVLSSIFFGITFLQTYQYYDQYWDDPLGLRIFVAVLGILDAAQLVTLVYTNWWYLIANYGHPIPGIVASLQIELITTTTITSLVQCFFAKRLWVLNRKHTPVVIFVIMLSIAQWGLALSYMIKGTHLETLVSITRLSAASIACGATADLLISISLCHFFYRNRTGVKSTDKVLHVLIIYAINTGLLTTLFAICTVTLEVSLLGTQWDTIPYFSLSKCYVNSVLATLNARTKIREMPWGFCTTEAFGVVSSRCSVARNYGCREGSEFAAFPALDTPGKKDREDAFSGTRLP
ncbi:hypothetical protein CERSUDRAFT_120642 [Gelatoporia subvermispora B]|uniref:DUF6534 domain-containing protein n=1 Tax=Ceriporiopsis subvermispora (strain B) TaxID=914234 RepID=M2QWW7_CERS8|nr:hypothetical protein CERSUDRAFT_120642 [Gelatoporia subvermispora B]